MPNSSLPNNPNLVFRERNIDRNVFPTFNSDGPEGESGLGVNDIDTIARTTENPSISRDTNAVIEVRGGVVEEALVAQDRA